MSFVMFTYDVKSERGVLYRKLLRRYLGHEQMSVFFGELPTSTLEKLRSELRQTVKDGDRVMEFIAENRHNLDIRTWQKNGYVEGVPSVLDDSRHKQESVIL
jgi:CRISPR-associated protein Cas2